jgi:hypothetical protein
VRVPQTFIERLDEVAPTFLKGPRANTAKVIWALEEFLKNKQRRSTGNKESASESPAMAMN